MEYDLVIRGGSIADGAGGEIIEADVAIVGAKIAEVGKVAGRGAEEIDAKGKLVTPGFIDPHTHYDGQVIWEDRTAPSSSHGVTTVLMGNCGVGFAPCRAQDRERLIRLMEGVEDVPQAVMAEGLPWNWESFPDYLDVIAGRRRDIDYATQLPHSCLRVFVMGERGVARQAATEDDLRKMKALTTEALRAGALGFGTSRTILHQDSQGTPIPTKDAAERELQAIADGMTAAGHGVIEALFDLDHLEEEFATLKRVAQKSGRPLSFTVLEHVNYPTKWADALDLIRRANAEGVRIRAQVLGRPTGMLMGHNLSFNPLTLHPSYQALKDLPLAEKAKALLRPEVRAKILSESPKDSAGGVLKFLINFESMYELGTPPNYEPPHDQNIAAIAARKGVSPEEICYDLMLKDNGNAMIFLALCNYVKGNLDNALRMMKDENTLLGLGDGGAHYGMICDANYPTFMLTYWTRDRKGERLGVPAVIKGMTSEPAEAIGLLDRGRIARGYKADINVIDYDRLRLHQPHVDFDLPAGGRRLVQAADGYVATLVSGKVIQHGGKLTEALPGRLVRGPQPSPF